MNKTYTLLFILFASVSFLQAQSVQSSCMSGDSLYNYYDFDATKLAIRELYNNNATDTAEIVVAEEHKENIMAALLAVHQAYSLPSRDEVVDFFNIHALEAPVTNSFVLYVDTSFAWVREWENSEIFTGLDAIDSWVDSFDLVLSRSTEMVYNEDLGGDYLKVSIQTNHQLNMKPLMAAFVQVDGVVGADQEVYESDTQKDIKYEYNEPGNYVNLTYSYGWGDCQTGCTNEHFWTFRVDLNDCTVELTSDGGDILQINNPTQISQIAVYPNPTSDVVTVNLIGPAKSDFILRLHDAYGQLILEEHLDFHNGFINLQVDLTPLPVGVYFLAFSYENQLLTERVMKR